VEQWDVFEIVLTGSSAGNPYLDTQLSAQFSQAGESVDVSGFYDGEGAYKVRFMPPAPGEWRYKTQSNRPELNGKTGSFTVIPPSANNHGPVRVFKTFYLRYADGTPYHQFGTTCYAWVHQTEELQEQTLKTLAASPFNKIRFCIFPKSYAYNKNEPDFFAFQKGTDGAFDFNRPDPEFWRRLEQRILDLQKIGIEADLILWHPYDRWGFSKMSDQQDDQYLRYCIARLSAFRNVWWSLANEYDLMLDNPGIPENRRGNKQMDDWDRFFRILEKEDPSRHLRGIHNCKKWYDHTKAWVTHASLQTSDMNGGVRFREKYQKPVIYDECKYEGDIPQGWGRLSAKTMTQRFWLGTMGGCYVGHGETYKHPQDILWWSKGGELHGESPKRIQWLKDFMAKAPPFDELQPLGDDKGRFILATPGEYYLLYCLNQQPQTLQLAGSLPYKVEVIDPWEMTIASVGTAPAGSFSISAPKPDLAYRFTLYRPGEKILPEAKIIPSVTGGLLPLTVKLTVAPDTKTRIQSPDGNVAVEFLLQEGGVPAYKIEYLGKPIVLPSRLGLEPDFTGDFQMTGTCTSAHEGQWTQVYGERKVVPDNYRELNVDLKHKSGRLLRITFRAYNEGAALRYSLPQQSGKQFKFSGERSEFRFPVDTYAYEEHGTEGEYQRVKTGEIQPWCERPLTLVYADGRFASLAEADNEHYPRMLLSPLPDVPGALVSALGGKTSNTASPNQRHDPNATLSAGDSTPWRMFVVGEKPGDLLERNYLMLNLNPPLAISDTSWIKPGKVMRDTTLTTENSQAIIDFAEKAGLRYVQLDWKWYGSEDAKKGDATTVRAPNLDIPEIIRYGREKNVGLIVYVDRRQIKSQRDILFPLYEKWGIAGVKIGFVDVGPQAETAWITETIQKAAQHHLMLNIHDGYRSTGLSRTYPNLMTVEGIRGNEHMPTPEHNCTLPFTRYIAGPGDYTVCYYDSRIKTTHAHQLAMTVVSYSPLQWVFWYDRPSLYRGEPEIEFFQKVPTVWDETKVIDGKIGQYASIARRSGADWFIGTINSNEERTLQAALTFLDPDKEYVAHIYSDDPSVETRTKVGVETRPVDSTAILEVKLKPGGGQAVWITPNQ
jgi:alpha-glucosidase